MGKGEKDEGIIPRLCKDLFNRINMDHDEDSQYSVEVEILVVYMMQSAWRALYSHFLNHFKIRRGGGVSLSCVLSQVRLIYIWVSPQG